MHRSAPPTGELTGTHGWFVVQVPAAEPGGDKDMGVITEQNTDPNPGARSQNHSRNRARRLLGRLKQQRRSTLGKPLQKQPARTSNTQGRDRNRICGDKHRRSNFNLGTYLTMMLILKGVPGPGLLQALRCSTPPFARTSNAQEHRRSNINHGTYLALRGPGLGCQCSNPSTPANSNNSSRWNLVWKHDHHNSGDNASLAPGCDHL